MQRQYRISSYYSPTRQAWVAFAVNVEDAYNSASYATRAYAAQEEAEEDASVWVDLHGIRWPQDELLPAGPDAVKILAAEAA